MTLPQAIARVVRAEPALFAECEKRRKANRAMRGAKVTEGTEPMSSKPPIERIGVIWDRRASVLRDIASANAWVEHLRAANIGTVAALREHLPTLPVAGLGTHLPALERGLSAIAPSDARLWPRLTQKRGRTVLAALWGHKKGTEGHGVKRRLLRGDLVTETIRVNLNERGRR